MKAAWFTILAAGGSAWLLAWGPLNMAAGGQIAITVLGTVAAAMIAWQYQRVVRLEDPGVSKKWKKYITWTILLTGLSWGCVSLVQLYDIGFFAPVERNRLITYIRLCRAIETTYPYSDVKEVDAANLCRKYQEQAATAPTDEAFVETVQAMLREFGDSHTYVNNALLDNKHTFAIIAEIEGKAVVTRIGKTARAAGLFPGAVILSVDGKSIDELISSDDGMLFYGSTPWQRRMNAFAQILSTERDQLQVSFQTDQGEVVTVDLVWPTNPAKTPPVDLGEAAIITGERLSSGVGYIRIPTFRSSSGHDLVKEFDRVLDAQIDATALILDLRGNPGGSTWISDRIAGRFFEKSFTYGREYYQRRIPIHAWRIWNDYEVRPRGKQYEGRVVLLIDGTNLSTAEQFAAAFRDSGRATLIGQRTSGGSGNPFCFQLSGGRACFSTGDFRRNDGTPIEGVGVQPDVEMSLTVDDIRLGRDPALSYAVQLLSTVTE